MKRRSVLALCATSLLSLTGCLFDTSETPEERPSATVTATAPPPSPTATPPRTRTPLPDRTVPFPDGPKAEPPRPADLTLRTAIQYVRTFHYRATFNEVWGSESSAADLSCQVLRAAQRGSVYRVVARCDTPLNVEPSANASGDDLSPGRIFVYLLDENSLVRRPRD